MTIIENDLLKHFKDRSVLCITDSDLDGVSAHIIAREYLQPIVKYFEFEITNDREFKDINYSLIEKKIFDLIIFVDTSPKKELYDILLTHTKEIFIFDHHISGRYELGDLDNYYFDPNRCGARIFFEEITRNIRVKRVVKQFIELVDTYDRWQDQSLLWRDAKRLHNVLMGSAVWWNKLITNRTRFNLFINRLLDKFQYTKTFFLSDTEKSIADDGEAKERKALDGARKTAKYRTDNDGNKYIWFECTSKISFVANSFLKEHANQIQYCIGYSTYNKSKLSLSLRSIPNFDCSVLAEKYGGGGHKNASGVDLTNNKEFFDKLRLGEAHLV